MAEVRFGEALELAQDDRRDLLRRVLPRAHRHARAFPHAPFDRTHRAVRVQHILVLGRLANEQRTVVGDAHHRRQDTHATGHRYNFHASVAHHGDLGVGGTQIDTNNDLTHACIPFLLTMTSAARNSSWPCRKPRRTSRSTMPSGASCADSTPTARMRCGSSGPPSASMGRTRWVASNSSTRCRVRVKPRPWLCPNTVSP